MKQLLQNLKTGSITVEQVPPPVLHPPGILVRSRNSLISAGTERMVAKLAKRSLLGKARERPDLVRKVLAKVRRDGLLAARLKDAVAGLGPLTVLYRCNAGPLPADHWIADPAEGGRILGEARHFVDFFAYLTDSMPRAGVFGSETCFAPTKGTIRSCPPSWPRCVPKAKCPSTPIRFA